MHSIWRALKAWWREHAFEWWMWWRGEDDD